MSDAIWIVLIVNFLGMVGLLGKAYFDYKARKALPKRDNPGNYGVKIGKLETEVENIKEDIRDIKRMMK